MSEHWHTARFAEAFELAVPLAEAVGAPAQGVVGWRCVFVPDVTTGVERGVAWLERAASAGFAQSCADLATLHVGGIADRGDSELADRYRALAVRFGFPTVLL